MRANVSFAGSAAAGFAPDGAGVLGAAFDDDIVKPSVSAPERASATKPTLNLRNLIDPRLTTALPYVLTEVPRE